MKAKLLIIIATLTGLAACKKDSFNTTPQLTFQSVNGGVFGADQVIRFTLEFTDKEGDVQDSLWVQKISRSTVCRSFVEGFAIPSFTAVNNSKGKFEVSYSTTFISNDYAVLPNCSRNDTCFFRFWITDKAKNRSDTVNSPNIVILR
jgi:hypothetical protein